MSEIFDEIAVVLKLKSCALLQRIIKATVNKLMRLLREIGRGRERERERERREREREQLRFRLLIIT